MKLIGAGLPRTGTLSQKVALEMLGLGPCYHMVNVLGDLDQAEPAVGVVLSRWFRDYFVLVGLVILYAVLLVGLNLLVDLAYLLLDRRVKYG